LSYSAASDVVPHYQGIVGVASARWAETNAHTLVSFIRGYLAALRWLFERANRGGAERTNAKCGVHDRRGKCGAGRTGRVLNPAKRALASLISHAIAALGIGTVFARPGIPKRVWAIGAVCSILPDIDVVGFRFGIRYGDFWGHRGFTHSLLFASILATLALVVGCPHPLSGLNRTWLWLYFFLATASHGFLDAMTNGGLGVAFFSPFHNTRFFLPWRPILVSPDIAYAICQRAWRGGVAKRTCLDLDSDRAAGSIDPRASACVSAGFTQIEKCDRGVKPLLLCMQ